MNAPGIMKPEITPIRRQKMEEGDFVELRYARSTSIVDISLVKRDDLWVIVKKSSWHTYELIFNEESFARECWGQVREDFVANDSHHYIRMENFKEISPEKSVCYPYRYVPPNSLPKKPASGLIEP